MKTSGARRLRGFAVSQATTQHFMRWAKWSNNNGH
jgi:hypothetical protein